MRTLHLFSGIGGGLYADLILGHTPVCAVELDPYCCAVLRERRDEGWWPSLFVWEGDVRLFDPSPWKGRVDCIHAGFPCQDISVAGPGAGIYGEKSGLWSEVERCVRVIRPEYVFLENSSAITCRGLGRVLGELAALGYDAEWTVLGAEDVGAGHVRERWWCLAYLDMQGEEELARSSTERIQEPDELGCEAESVTDVDQERRNWRPWVFGEAGRGQSENETLDAYGLQLREQSGGLCREGRTEDSPEPGRMLEEVANLGGESRREQRGVAGGNRTGTREEPCGVIESIANPLRDRPQEPLLGRGIPEADQEAIEAVARYCGTPGWNPTFTDVCGVVDGLAGGIDEAEANANKGKRIEALGNAQVPLAAAAAWIMLGGPIA